MSSEFQLREFCGHQIRQRNSDGYLCATDMCKAGSKTKSMKHYNANEQTREFLTCLEAEVDHPTSSLI